MRIKFLEEENKDLKSKVESLLHSNERLKTELVNRAKSEKFSETRKYHDTKYKSKYSKSSTPTNKVGPLKPHGDTQGPILVHKSVRTSSISSVVYASQMHFWSRV